MSYLKLNIKHIGYNFHYVMHATHNACDGVYDYLCGYLCGYLQHVAALKQLSLTQLPERAWLMIIALVGRASSVNIATVQKVRACQLQDKHATD